MEKIDFVNLTQPAINDSNLNRMQDNIERAINAQVSGDTLPLGAMIPFPGGTIPENYLLCDGSAVSRTTYSLLFNVIGTIYGAGDGSTTFNLPDMRGRVPVGVDSSQTEFDTLGETGGEKTHTLTVDEMPSHTHTPTVSIHGNSDGITIGSAWSEGFYTRSASGTNLELTSAGGNQPHNILQPYQTTNYIIKAFQTAGTVAQILNTHSVSTTDSYSADYINNLNTYSTTEKRIGTWIDGKPLYTITKDCGELYNNARKEISTSAIIPTTARVVHIEGDCTRYNAGLHDTVPLFTRVTLALYRSEQQKILLDTDSDQTAWTAIVTLFYTKTTD